MMDLGLRDRVALITGAGQGVGRGIARLLAGEGAKVAVNDLYEARATRVAVEIEAAGGVALAVPADITRPEQVEAMATTVAKTLGPVDILVNNAGIIPERRTGEVGLAVFADSQPEHWRKIVDLNFYGSMYCTHAVVRPMMERRRGKIVSIISEAGRVGEARYAVYAGAKAAMHAFSKSLARELGPYRINVNVVALGAVAHEAPMADFLSEDATPDTNDTLKRMLRAYPVGEGLGRIGRPRDAAAAVAYLCSDLAEFVTGQCLAANGGFAMI
jgi:2-hydroxycyclohexanecarboxyl-CoA dehydrogenase